MEVKRRIEMARGAFVKMSKIFKCHDFSLSTNIRILRCYIFPILLYGVETWTLTEALSKKIEASEMWLYRQILNISWTDRLFNVCVLQRMQMKRNY